MPLVELVRALVHQARLSEALEASSTSTSRKMMSQRKCTEETTTTSLRWVRMELRVHRVSMNTILREMRTILTRMTSILTIIKTLMMTKMAWKMKMSLNSSLCNNSTMEAQPYKTQDITYMEIPVKNLWMRMI